VSVLTGLFPPTSGDCIIYGQSIVQDIQAARHSIGICPQHNVLFDSLTVAEHLRFFMKIKGLTPSAAAVQRHACEIGLTDFLDSRSASLSGGNKRKLSVAIALCADPKCLILDEPTSAMDPHSRRAVWELLRAKRKGRVTLLTTHFLDEAEILCDRIAVMKDGKLQCTGSLNFLKERFGLGYNLTVVLEPMSRDQHEGNEKGYGHPLVFASQLIEVTAIVRNVIPGTEVIRVSGKEVTFRIPRGSEQLLPDLFDTMEAESDERGIGAFGVRDSSLEEIFLQLAEDGYPDEDGLVETRNPELQTFDVKTEPISPQEPDQEALSTANNYMEPDVVSEVSRSPGGSYKDYGSTDQAVLLGNDQPSSGALKDMQDLDELHNLSPLRQIGLLYWKRYVVQRRDVKGLCFTVIVPLIVIALVLLVLLIEPPYVGSAIELSPTLYSEVVGERSKTGVAIGLETNSSLDYASISSNLVQQYLFVEVSRVQNATSQKLSDYFLETYNERVSPPRFGALALDDVVDVSFRVDWNNILTSSEDLVGLNISSLVPSVGQGWANLAPLLVPWFLDVFSTLYAAPGEFNVTALLTTLTGTSLSEVTEAGLYFLGIDGNTLVTFESYESFNMSLLEFLNRSIAGATLDDLVTLSIYDFVNITLGSMSADITTEDLSVMSISDFLNFTLGPLPPSYNAPMQLSSVALFDFVNSTFGPLNSDVDVKELSSVTLGALLNATQNVLTPQWSLTDLSSKTLWAILNSTFGPLPTDANVTAISSLTLGTLLNSTIGPLREEANATDVLSTTLWTLLNSTFGPFPADANFDDLSSITIGALLNSTSVNLEAMSSLTLIDFLNAFFEDFSVADLSSLLINNVVPVDDSDANPNNISVYELIESAINATGLITDDLARVSLLEFIDSILAGFNTTAEGLLNTMMSQFNSSNLNIADLLPNLSSQLQDAIQTNFTFLQDVLPEGIETYILQVQTRASILHNASSPHAVAAFNQAFASYLYQSSCSTSNTSRLASVNEPLPMTQQQSIEVQTILSILAAIFLLIPFGYIPGAFIVFLVKERVSKSKHLQLVSGVNMTSYWFSQYIWDLTLFAILTFGVMMVRSWPHLTLLSPIL
jgi:ABC-type multidrug transport system ATPase subunit